MSDEATPSSAVALVPVRSGMLPVGADEVVAEAGGHCWLVGTGCRDAIDAFETPVIAATVVEAGDGLRLPGFADALAAALVERLGDESHVILPSSPDGRDLAPHLAVALERPLVAGATEVGPDRAIVARQDGHTMETLALGGPVVATLQPDVRSIPGHGADGPRPAAVYTTAEVVVNRSADEPRVELIEEIPADPATMDLGDARRIVAGGAGLGTPENFDALLPVAEALGASTGATRVVTDHGWISTDRQIGTTGVTVDPDLYIAVGISGAVQHTAGLGSPEHVVVVNTDPHCPMMELADVAIVCDGPDFVRALGAALAGFSRTPASPGGRREQVPEA